jgi:hypothetical protein
MDQRLKNYLQGLLHQAINAGIFAAMWKMPLGKLLIVLGILIAIAVVFGLY